MNGLQRACILVFPIRIVGPGLRSPTTLMLACSVKGWQLTMLGCLHGSMCALMGG